MRNHRNRSEVRRAFLHVFWGILLIAAIGYIDYLTSDYSMLIFYAIPVALNAWFLGDYAAVILSLTSGCARFISDYYSYAPNDFRYWNSVEDMVFLILIGLVISSVKRLLDNEDRERTATKST